MKQRRLGLLAAVAVAVATAGPALSAPKLGNAGAGQLIAAHARLRARLAPADRQLLDALAARVRAALPRDPHLPEDARRVIAAASHGGLSPDEVDALADDVTTALMEATQQMQESQMSFNMQYLQLQSQMQNENRSYTAVSNIMKTKHDTVKNTISNIR